MLRSRWSVRAAFVALAVTGCGGSNTPFGDVRPCSDDEEACKPVSYSDDAGSTPTPQEPQSDAAE
jgi:hypothetical protein